jgi:hypothetical protein
MSGLFVYVLLFNTHLNCIKCIVVLSLGIFV